MITLDSGLTCKARQLALLGEFVVMTKCIELRKSHKWVLLLETGVTASV